MLDAPTTVIPTSTASAYPFRHPIATIEELRALIGMPGELAVRKELAALDAHCRTFIAHAPFVLVGTAGASGRVDVSPRGDGPGFALVLDEQTVVIPDRPGNKRVDSFQNVLENPHAGLLFVIPGVEETLRVNGRATLVRDPDVLERMSAQGKTPLLALAVHVEEAFLQCAKALRRSRLWQPETWPDRSMLPSGGRIWLDQTKPANTTAEELDCRIEASYVTNLY
jgi:PPOX class probable FMN-dependent enzyme